MDLFASSSTVTRSLCSTTMATSSRSATGEEGIYHDGTRFVSCLTLEIEGDLSVFPEFDGPRRQ